MEWFKKKGRKEGRKKETKGKWLSTKNVVNARSFEIRLMQSNHPCKEIVHFYSLPDFFYSSLSLSLFSSPINKRPESTIGKKKKKSSWQLLHRVSLFPSFSSTRSDTLPRLALSRRFRSIKSVSQFQPRVAPVLDLYRFQPITFRCCETLFLATCPLSRANWSCSIQPRYRFLFSSLSK